MEQRIPRVGDKVNVAQKKDYETGELTAGVVAEVLTKKRYHSRGHKVRLTNGIVGRVQSFGDAPSVCRSTDTVSVSPMVMGKRLEEGSPRSTDLPGPDDLR